jgi:hypothetical protein
LRDFVPPIRAAGAELYVIGNGSAAQARDFARDQHVGYPLYTDPSLRSYAAAGFKNETVVSPKVLLRAFKAFLEGHIQTTTKGTASQHGGAFVFDRGGAELFAYRSEAAGDHPDPRDLVAALTRRQA